jgi:hypothetical protein
VERWKRWKEQALPAPYRRWRALQPYSSRWSSGPPPPPPLVRRWRPLQPRGGTGKSHLLEYLLSDYWQQERQVQEPRLIRVVIEEHRLGSLRSKGAVYATAEACLAFSGIAEQLGIVSERYDPESVWAKCVWYKQPHRLYSDNAFHSLAAFVRSELRRLRVIGVIIDNAQYIDHCTMQSLIRVRTLLNGELALILSAPIDKPQEANEHVEGLMARSGAADEFELPLELRQLEEIAFTGSVLNELLKEMCATFATNLPPLTKALMRTIFWSATARDWRVVAKKTRGLTRALASQKGPIREITLESGFARNTTDFRRKYFCVLAWL